MMTWLLTSAISHHRRMYDGRMQQAKTMSGDDFVEQNQKILVTGAGGFIGAR